MRTPEAIWEETLYLDPSEPGKFTFTKAALAAIRTAQAEALEEAAKVADRFLCSRGKRELGSDTRNHVIRTLAAAKDSL